MQATLPNIACVNYFTVISFCIFLSLLWIYLPCIKTNLAELVETSVAMHLLKLSCITQLVSVTFVGLCIACLAGKFSHSQRKSILSLSCGVRCVVVRKLT